MKKLYIISALTIYTVLILISTNIIQSVFAQMELPPEEVPILNITEKESTNTTVSNSTNTTGAMENVKP